VTTAALVIALVSLIVALAQLVVTFLLVLPRIERLHPKNP